MYKRIIPCLDIDRGRVTRGVQYQNVRDVGDPLELAKRYDAQEADELVFYDITASSDGRDLILPVLELVSSEVFMPLTVGGGVKTLSDFRRLLAAGADKISVDSSAVANPGLIYQASEHFGSQCVVLSMQAKRQRGPDGQPLNVWQTYIKGGREATGLDAVAWAVRAQELGAGELVLNSIDGDGTKGGYDLELCRAVKAAVDLPVVASGGAGRLADFASVLQAGCADAALAASVFHFGTHTVPEVKGFLAEHGIAVRPASARA
jgi:imidazole glycerol-phosphate synthase subunit HisF